MRFLIDVITIAVFAAFLIWYFAVKIIPSIDSVI